MTYRTVVNGVIRNPSGEIFICKKPADRGIFPGQWAIPGGGIGTNETAQQSLIREITEETGLNITNIKPLFFYELQTTKYHPTETKQDLQLTVLVYSANSNSDKVILDHEHEEYAWIKPANLGKHNFNPATKKTFKQMGLL